MSLANHFGFGLVWVDPTRLQGKANERNIERVKEKSKGRDVLQKGTKLIEGSERARERGRDGESIGVEMVRGYENEFGTFIVLLLQF